MSNLAKERVTMTPQLSQKDVPQDSSDSEPEDVEENGVIFVETSSDEDEDDNDEVDAELENNNVEDNGYLPLGQDATDQTVEDFSHQPFVENGETESTAVTDNVENGITFEEETEDNLAMEQDQVDLIRQVMTNISLPSAAIPDWAKNVPEDKWKAVLVSNIANRSQPREESSCFDTKR